MKKWALLILSSVSVSAIAGVGQMIVAPSQNLTYECADGKNPSKEFINQSKWYIQPISCKSQTTYKLGLGSPLGDYQAYYSVKHPELTGYAYTMLAPDGTKTLTIVNYDGAIQPYGANWSEPSDSGVQTCQSQCAFQDASQ